MTVCLQSVEDSVEEMVSGDVEDDTSTMLCNLLGLLPMKETSSSGCAEDGSAGGCVFSGGIS